MSAKPGEAQPVNDLVLVPRATCREGAHAVVHDVEWGCSGQEIATRRVRRNAAASGAASRSPRRGTRRTRRPAPRPIRTTAIVASSFRWAPRGSVGAEHAAVTRFRSQYRAAARTFVEELARVRRHRLNLDVPASWTGQRGFQDEFHHGSLDARDCGRSREAFPPSSTAVANFETWSRARPSTDGALLV